MSEEKKEEKKFPRRKYLGAVGGLAAVAAVGWGLAGYMASTRPAPGAVGLSGDIPIGIAGSDAADSDMIYGSADLAVEDINAWWKEIGVPARLVGNHENFEESAAKAVEKTSGLLALGVKFIVGPTWSSHALAMKSMVDEKKVVVISPTSSSGAVAIAKDYIFRLANVDAYEGPAHIAILNEFGIKYLIIVNTTDSACESASEKTIPLFEAQGGKVVDRFRLDPESKEFSAEAKLIADKIKESIGKYGKENVGAILIALNVVITSLLKDLKNNPEVYEAKWFGCGNNWGGFPIILERVPDVVADLKFPMEVASYVSTERGKQVLERFKAKVGHEGVFWVNFAYDCVWLGALSMMAVGKYDGEAMAKALPSVANNYFGASGQTPLDENGDRANPAWDVNVYTKKPDGSVVWDKVGYIDSATGKVVWTKEKPKLGS